MEFKRTLNPVLFFAIFGNLLGCVFSEIYFAKGAPNVKLTNGGKISGKVQFSRDGRPYNSFLGIPFATFKERFEEPTPLKDPTWEGVKSFAEPGPVCAQMDGLMPGYAKEGNGEGDCLNLNVFVPLNMEKSGSKGYPVIVSIHGGGFSFGDSMTSSNPRFFMDEDVIVVTMNYRVGVFGFLSTEDEVIPGNNGLKDILLAFKWVQENIKAFGGNPDKVTALGVSAGGAAVHHLTLSEKANGLFHRAIVQSGSAFAQWAFRPRPRETAVELATHMNCSTNAGTPKEISSQEIRDCLRKLSTEEMKMAQYSFKASWPMAEIAFLFSPSVEPKSTTSTSVSPVHTKSPYELLTDKKSCISQVPLMIGFGEEEGASLAGGIISANDTLLNQLNSNWDELIPDALDFAKYLPSQEERAEVSKKIREFYFGSNPINKEMGEKVDNIYSDELVNYSVYKSAVETAKRGGKHPVYFYQFGYYTPDPWADGVPVSADVSRTKKKVGHAGEITLEYDYSESFGMKDEFFQSDSADETFSKNFIKLWTSFAIHGKPKYFWGSASDNEWKPISKKEAEGQVPLTWYRIDENSEHVAFPLMERMSFWDKLFKDHFSQTLLSCKKEAKC